MSNTATNTTTVEKTFIKRKDRDLESTIETMHTKLDALGIEIEEASWLNPVPNVYSVHIRDKDCELMFTNGKGATEKACLASAFGPSGEGYVRMAYCVDEDTINRAFDYMDDYFK